MRFTERLVGIDVIGWNPALPSQQVRSFLSTMRPYCHINEYRFIQSFADPSIQLRTFHLFWSLKEALLKAIGCGIADPARPLSQYDFSRCRKEHAAIYRSLPLVKPTWASSFLLNFFTVSATLRIREQNSRNLVDGRLALGTVQIHLTSIANGDVQCATHVERIGEATILLVD